MIAQQVLSARRSTDDGVVSGVCGGIAKALGIDPTILRLAICALTLAGGVGVIVYAALSAIVLDGDSPPHTRPSVRAVEIVAGVVSFGVGTGLLAMFMLPLLLDGGYITGLVLVVLGIWGLVHSGTRDDEPRWR